MDGPVSLLGGPLRVVPGWFTGSAPDIQGKDGEKRHVHSALNFAFVVESRVGKTPVDTEEDFRARILAACDSVRTIPGLFQRIPQNLVRRCHVCIEAEGRNFEHL
ncbi:hypothetical protein ANN_10818 [Periplaneta americana]|uniref:Per a allergen n=1 Tax=Periplaneta americana TaxID=6978 RepID=A0ABQ8T3B6_PERAM|nr:hypothetical protein ANN_10818 [Periplaneta americana]